MGIVPCSLLSRHLSCVISAVLELKKLGTINESIGLLQVWARVIQMPSFLTAQETMHTAVAPLMDCTSYNTQICRPVSDMVAGAARLRLDSWRVARAVDRCRFADRVRSTGDQVRVLGRHLHQWRRVVHSLRQVRPQSVACGQQRLCQHCPIHRSTCTCRHSGTVPVCLSHCLLCTASCVSHHRMAMGSSVPATLKASPLPPLSNGAFLRFIQLR